MMDHAHDEHEGRHADPHHARVRCVAHGLVYLSAEEYARQESDVLGVWRCTCGEAAEFDERYFANYHIDAADIF